MAAADITGAITDMAYVRDSDRKTRGIGAIAAADHSMARARQRVQVARGTRARDQVMSAIAGGALGRTPFQTETPGSAVLWAPAGTETSPFVPGQMYPGGSVGVPVGVPGTPSEPVATTPPFVPGQVYPGGAIGVPGTPSGPPLLVLPPGPVATASLPESQSGTIRNVLLIGGAAAVAFWFFRRKP